MRTILTILLIALSSRNVAWGQTCDSDQCTINISSARNRPVQSIVQAIPNITGHIVNETIPNITGHVLHETIPNIVQAPVKLVATVVQPTTIHHTNTQVQSCTQTSNYTNTVASRHQPLLGNKPLRHLLCRRR